MHRVRRIVTIAYTIILLTGCADIPADSITVNEKVSGGIETMKQNTDIMIDAWKMTALTVLEGEFDDIYGTVEEKLRGKRGIAANKPLSPDEQRDVAAFVVLVNGSVRGKIDAEVAKMQKVNADNAATIKAANDSITKLLKSANKLGASRDALLQDVSGLLPIPADVAGFVKSAKKAAVTESGL